jgi:AraC family transcriptional regulator
VEDKTLYIKNMVCNRCVKSVAGILDEIGISYTTILMGEISLEFPLDENIREILSERLKSEGFELIDDKKSRIISKVKKIILEYVQHLDYNSRKILISEYLSEKLNMEYSGLSNLFSSVEGQTIENYLIAQKVERAKELIVYDEMTLSEIAFKLGYSSTAHLSNQFKKVTGLTPTHFKTVGAVKRIPLDEI